MHVLMCLLYINNQFGEEAVYLTKCTHPPLRAQVLCAKHFISPALQMDADGNRLFELHSL